MVGDHAGRTLPPHMSSHDTHSDDVDDCERTHRFQQRQTSQLEHGNRCQVDTNKHTMQMITSFGIERAEERTHARVLRHNSSARENHHTLT